MSLLAKAKSKSMSRVIQMIRQIKDHPELWQSSHKRYKDKLVRERAWKEVAKALNKDDQTIRKRWKNLKDAFRKELKRILANEVEESPWHYFEELSFLTETILRGIVGKDGDDTINVMSSIKDLNANEGDSDDPLLVKKERLDAADPEPSATVDVLIDTSAPVDSNTAVDSSNMVTAMKGDADYMFLASLLPTMRKLTDLQKLQFRGKVNQWLLDALQENQNSYTDKGADSDDSFDRKIEQRNLY